MITKAQAQQLAFEVGRETKLLEHALGYVEEAIVKAASRGMTTTYMYVTKDEEEVLDSIVSALNSAGYTVKQITEGFYSVSWR